MRPRFWLVVFSLLPLAAFAGCGKLKPAAEKEKTPAVAVVNGDEIYAADLKRELALRAKRNPSFKVTPGTLQEQLDTMINRKLLIQEAVRRKLTDEERFTTAIKAFWEQTLIRVLMDDLAKDFKDSEFATEAEIQDYYSRLGAQATFEVMRSPDPEAARQFYEAAQKGGAVTWQEKVGPASYDSLASEVLRQAFALKTGEIKAMKSGDLYYVVRMAAKESIPPPALETVRQKIASLIKQRKQAEAFESWLKERRAKAEIQLKPDTLKGQPNGAAAKV